MSKKIYVGKIPYSFNDQDLENLFAAYGAVVSAKVIFDRESGKSKGFGFVEMSSNEEATKAIEELNGKLINGKGPLTVNEARPMENNRGGGGGGGNRRGNPPPFRKQYNKSY